MTATESTPTSSFCSSTKAVIQIHRGSCIGQIMVADRRAEKIESWMILPENGRTIACPLNYFQENASLLERWITNDNGLRINLKYVNGLDGVTVTIFENGGESKCGLPDDLNCRLLTYFMLDIVHNEGRHHGFDCYAFVSFLTNTEFRPEDPPFEYAQSDARAGNIVALANSPELPKSIMHWALCIGENLFISKFGKTGIGAQALVEVTDTQAMLSLYNCNRVLVASRKGDAAPWNCERYLSESNGSGSEVSPQIILVNQTCEA